MSYNTQASSLLGDDSYAAYNRSDSSSSSDWSLSSFRWSLPSLSALSEKAREHKRSVIGVVLVVVLVVLIAAIASAARSSSAPGDGGPRPWLNVRLPGDVVPLSYVIDLMIDVPNERYWGTTSIGANVTRTTSIVLLQSEYSPNTSITGVNVTRTDEPGSVVPSSFWLYPANDYIVVELSQPLAGGSQVVIGVSFANLLDVSLRGLYQSTYFTSEDGKGRKSVRIATTQFEATDFRKAFPGFDEPDFKARFTMVISAPLTSPTILSNMPVSLATNFSHNGQPWQRVVFQTSPPMSTYLVALVVSDYDRACTTFQTSKPFCVYASPAKIANGEAAQAAYIGAKQLDFYDKYFAQPFPLPKQDMVAIADFAAGAMENWGLITYRETAVLYDPAVQTQADYQSIARVIAHELAHQFFGDLTTMIWWSALWLNEGFASYVQYLGVASVFPDWQGEAQFLTDTAAAAYAIDALPAPGTHPIVDLSAQTPAQISSLFDTLSYNKGALLLRQMERFLTRSVFQTGLQNYLSKYAFGNADSSDLMSVLTTAAVTAQRSLPASVNVLMDSFLHKIGYPLVTITESFNTDGTITFTAQQSHFLSAFNSPVDYSIQWWVPISWLVHNVDGTNSTEAALSWLAPGSSALTLPVSYSPRTNNYIIFNRGKGFYQRVLYPHAWYDIFARALASNYEQFDIDDRTQLLMDTFAFAHAGLVPWSAALNLTQYIGGNDGERTLTPITELIMELNRLAPFFQGNVDDQKLWRSYTSSLFTSLLTYFGVPSLSNNHLYMMLMQRTWQAAAQYNVADVRVQLAEQFKQMYANQDPNYVKIPEMIALVYNWGMSVTDSAGAFAWVRALYDGSTSAAASARYLQSMASISDVVSLTKLLGWALDGTIRSQDSATVLSLVAANDYALFDNWMRANFNQVVSTFSSGYSGFGRVLSAWIFPIQTQSQLDSVTSFLSTRQSLLGSATASYNSAVLVAQQHIAFRENAVPAIRNWISWYLNSLV